MALTHAGSAASGRGCWLAPARWQRAAHAPHELVLHRRCSERRGCTAHASANTSVAPAVCRPTRHLLVMHHIGPRGHGAQRGAARGLRRQSKKRTRRTARARAEGRRPRGLHAARTQWASGAVAAHCGRARVPWSTPVPKASSSSVQHIRMHTPIGKEYLIRASSRATSRAARSAPRAPAAGGATAACVAEHTKGGEGRVVWCGCGCVGGGRGGGRRGAR